MSNRPDSIITMNPIKRLFHIGRDKEWQKVDVISLLTSDKEELSTTFANTSKQNEMDLSVEMTVRQIVLNMEKPTDPEKVWPDKGIAGLMAAVKNLKGKENPYGPDLNFSDDDSDDVV